MQVCPAHPANLNGRSASVSMVLSTYLTRVAMTHHKASRWSQLQRLSRAGALAGSNDDAFSHR